MHLAGLEGNSGKNSWTDSSLAPWLEGDSGAAGMRSGSCSHCTDRRESTNRRISYSSSFLPESELLFSQRTACFSDPSEF